MKYIIRLATADDCEGLSKLKHTVWIQTYRGIYSDDRIDNYDYDKNKEYFLNIVADPNVELYVVEDDGKLVGYMSCGVPYRSYKDYEQEIGLLYLLSDYQKKGIGGELFDIGYNRIKEKGYDEFFISCNKFNTNAQEFYKRMGGVVDKIDEDNEDKAICQIKYIYKIKKTGSN